MVKYDPIKFARSQGVKVGVSCRFIDTDTQTFGSEPYLITIGDHVTITSGVRFVTHDGGVWIFRNDEPEIDVIKRINISNNVFIGLNSIILPGVNIGENVVIGAGSVVVKDVSSNSVVAGVPARHIKSVKEYRSSLDVLKTKNMDASQKKAFLINTQ